LLVIESITKSYSQYGMSRAKKLPLLGNGMIHVSGKKNSARHVWLSRLNPENIEISRICSQLIHKAICIINALQALAGGGAEFKRKFRRFVDPLGIIRE
jgi:hypothetical protein